MKLLGIAAAIFLIGGSTQAETVTTTDGRSLELNADGTYNFLETIKTPVIKMAEQKPYFAPVAGEYGRNSIQFMPIFQNETDQTILGFKFRSVFKSAFGDEVFAFDGESSERIAKGSVSTAATFYFFEDNEFISGEPYDKLVIFQTSGTGSISSKVTAIVFENGEVIKLEK